MLKAVGNTVAAVCWVVSKWWGEEFGALLMVSG